MTTSQTLTPRLPRPRRESDFSSRGEATTAAREFFWGTVPFSKRECIRFDKGTLGMMVTANVNGRLVLIDFDNYGRVFATTPID